MAGIRLRSKEIKKFQKEILTWYAANGRDLPWRRTRDPYRILVSEIMLQQTQVARVIPKYEAWLKAFPTIEILARAKTVDVLRLWSGLGYNRRALYLQKTAQTLVQTSSSRHRGSMDSRFPARGEARYRRRGNDKRGSRSDGIEWPREVSELVKLPGVGRYTAGAVACFAFNEQIAVVDTNIRKVIIVRFGNKKPIRHPGGSKAIDSPRLSYGEAGRSGLRSCQTQEISRDSIAALRLLQNDKKRIASVALGDLAMIEKEVQEIADQLLPQGMASEWNQALMDYSSALLKKEKNPIKKQSKFIGSDRYYRGKLLRMLLKDKNLRVADLEKLLKPDSEWLAKLLMRMERDGLILVRNNMVSIQ